MLIQDILLLVSSYYLWHGAYPLLTNKPCLRANNFRTLIIWLLIIELIGIFIVVFLFFVALYGYTYAGITIGNMPFYILLFVFSLLVLWFFYRKDNNTDSLKHTVNLVAISPDHALVAVDDTLADMKINYAKTLSGFNMTDKDIAVKLTVSGKQICFSVSRPLDKIFLNQFCKIYQSVYKKKQYPISKRFCYLSIAIGLAFLMIFAFAVSDSAIPFITSFLNVWRSALSPLSL